jgi:hypothetical protein
MGRVTIEGVSYPDLTEFKVKTGSADVYSFRFQEPFGWAIFTVNNTTGEFHIQSDWGSWQYRWPVGDNLGADSAAHEKQLAHFLGTSNDAHYVTDKLSYNEPRTFRNEFSEEKTRGEMRRLVLAARLRADDVSPEVSEWMEEQVKEATGRELDDYGPPLDKTQARRFWKEIENWLGDHDMKSEAAQLTAIDDLRYRCEDLYDFLTGKNKNTRMIEREIWELFEHEASWGYTFLCQVLLPFFFAYLRDSVLKEPDAEEKKTA